MASPITAPNLFRVKARQPCSLRNRHIRRNIADGNCASSSRTTLLQNKDGVPFAFQKQIIYDFLLCLCEMELPTVNANLFKPGEHPVENAGSSWARS